ncbi:unnamed protein product, partial [Porites lobata]
AKKSAKKKLERPHATELSKNMGFCRTDVQEDDLFPVLNLRDRMLILVYHRRERLELTMPHTTNVIDLKLKIQSLTQILPRNQKLFFRGTQLLDKQILKEFKQDVVSLSLVAGPIKGGGKCSLPPAKEIEEWFISSYQKSIGNTVTKEAIFNSACEHFKGDVDTGCLEGPHEDKDTAGLEGPPCDVDITGPEGPPGDVDTTSSEGPPGDVKITGKAGISDEVNIEGIPDDVDTTCTEGPQGDVDTPAVEGTSHYVDTTGTERPQGDVDTPAVEGTVDNGDTKGTEGPQSDVDTSAIRGTIDYMDTTGTEGPQSLDEGDVDTTGLERKPGNEDLFHTGLEEPLQKSETATFAPLDQDGLPDLWEMPDWDDTGISTKPLVFEQKSFLSKSWSNTKIKEIKPKDLNCSSFEQLLAEKIPCPSMRMNNSERIRIYQESSQCSNNIDNTFRAFLCYAFPPLEISTKVAKEFRDLTYESDRFPQYTCICLSRLRNKIRVSIRCEICKLYEESCLRRGQFIKLGKSTQKEFDGISQVVAHHQSRVHQSAAMYLSGSKELDEDVSSNRGVVGDAKPLP